MSGIVRPKGGASSAVYWRRRLVLIAVALLVVAGGIKLFGGGGDESSEPSASDASDSKSSAESADDEKDEPRNHRRRRNRDSSTEAEPGQANVAVTMKGGTACDPTKVKVKPSLGSDEHAGGAVTLRLAFTIGGNSACVLDLGEHEPLLSVSDNDGPVWTSDRCDDLIDVESVRLEPGWSTYVDARWSGRASGRTCGDNADYASPGEYDVQAAILSGEPTEATITLPEPPKPDKDKADKNKGGNNGKNDKKSYKQGDDSQGGNSGSDESGGQGRGSNGEGSNQQRNN